MLELACVVWMAMSLESHGRRPCSVDLKGDNEITLSTIIDIFEKTDYLQKYRSQLEAVFQIGPETFNITLANEQARNELLNEQNSVHFKGKKYSIYLPGAMPTVVNIRAVPSETSDDVVRQAVERWKPGNIIGIKKMYHKNLKLHNGYRTVAIENYIENKLPPFINIEGANCKVFTPAYTRAPKARTCYKCKKQGHYAAACTLSKCDQCGREGHLRQDCPELEIDFPALMERGREEIKEGTRTNKNTSAISKPLLVSEEEKTAQSTHSGSSVEKTNTNNTLVVNNNEEQISVNNELTESNSTLVLQKENGNKHEDSLADDLQMSPSETDSENETDTTIIFANTELASDISASESELNSDKDGEYTTVTTRSKRRQTQKLKRLDISKTNEEQTSSSQCR